MSASNVLVEEPVEVTAVLENRGNASGSATVSLELDGEETESQTVTVDAAEEGEGTASTQVEVEFSWATEEPGDYDLSVNGHHAGTVTVEEEPESDIQVEDAEADPTTVEAGESVTVSATVQNHGDAEGEATLELEVDGQGVESQSVTLGADDQETVTFSWSSDDPDTYDLSVNGHHAGTVTVEAAPAQLSVTDAHIEPSEPVETMTALAVAEVSNTGGTVGALNVQFTVDGSSEGSEGVQVDPGDTETVEFEWTPENAGTHTLGFSQYSLDVEVLPATELMDAWLRTERIYVSQSGLVDVEVLNRTQTNQQVELILQAYTFVSGQPMWVSVDDTTGDIAPGTFEGVAFLFEPPGVGEWPLRVGQEEIGVREAGVLEAYGIEVTDAYLGSSVVDVGEELDVGVDASNHADESVVEEITLQIYAPTGSGRTRWVNVETEDWTMNAGSSIEWGEAFTLDFPETGDYPVRVCDEVGCEDAGTVTVSSR